MSSANDQLPVWLAGQPPKPLPTMAYLTAYARVLRLTVHLESQIARLTDADAVLRASLQGQLDLQHSLIAMFEEKHGRWTLPGVRFTTPSPGMPASLPPISPPPAMPASPPPAGQPFFMQSPFWQPHAMQSPFSQPQAMQPFLTQPQAMQPLPTQPHALQPLSTQPHAVQPPQPASPPPVAASQELVPPSQGTRGGLNRSVFSGIDVPRESADVNVTRGDQARISQVSARSVKMIIIWKTLVNDQDPRADVQQTQEPFAAICGLVKTCDPDRRAYYQSIRPATFRDFRSVQVSDNLQYKHDDGKVGPYRYGATPDAELWLCFATFHTFEVCPHGARCRYRHLTLTVHEIIWISRTVQGRKFVEGTFFKFWNAKGGKQPVHQARALPVPVSRQVLSSAAVASSGANTATNASRPLPPPLPVVAAQNEHAQASATGEQANATSTKRKADDADWTWPKRQRK